VAAALLRKIAVEGTRKGERIMGNFGKLLLGAVLAVLGLLGVGLYFPFIYGYVLEATRLGMRWYAEYMGPYAVLVVMTWALVAPLVCFWSVLFFGQRMARRAWRQRKVMGTFQEMQALLESTRAREMINEETGRLVDLINRHTESEWQAAGFRKPDVGSCWRTIPLLEVAPMPDE
jgi:hypothetical protein